MISPVSSESYSAVHEVNNNLLLVHQHQLSDDSSVIIESGILTLIKFKVTGDSLVRLCGG